MGLGNLAKSQDRTKVSLHSYLWEEFRNPSQDVAGVQEGHETKEDEQHGNQSLRLDDKGYPGLFKRQNFKPELPMHAACCAGESFIERLQTAYIGMGYLVKCSAHLIAHRKL